jgi:hypothetical protein
MEDGENEDAQYLRDKAKIFREMADQYNTELSPFLRELADEFEKRADQIEHRPH